MSALGGPMGLEQPLPTRREPAGPTPVRDGIGSSPARPDGALKTTGEFAYSSDLWARNMLWGATRRSPHPHARIRSIDVGPALAIDGVHAALTHDDVPGLNGFGLELKDQPVLAADTVRFQGEAVAVVAAVDPDTARRAAAAIVVDYEPLTPLADAEAALRDDAVALHADGNVMRRVTVRHGDMDIAAAQAEVVVSGEYEVGMQDQAFLGPESGLVIPREDGGVDIFVATQWLHLDAMQVADCLALPVEKVQMTLAGVGGAFGGREDLSIHVHASMLALRTGRPVKMVYSREESFVGGHVHRHPARMRYEHGATRDGRLVYVKARIILDGGAYASTSGAVVTTAAVVGAGPYEVPHAELDAWAVYTNNPPCGAMRGFGSVQVCFAHESQMDRLAAELGMDPVELRLRNAMATGTELPTGQVVEDRAPVTRLLEELRAIPLPAGDGGPPAAVALPGGVANTTHGEGVRRGVGYGVGFKNISFPAGFPDFSTATVKLSVAGGEPIAEVHTAAAEVGQGLVTIQAQIARTELGVDRAFVRTADTTIGMAGGTSASRQTWMTGGAVKAACEAVREVALQLARDRGHDVPGDARLDDGHIVDAGGDRILSLAELIGDDPIEETREYFPVRQTTPLDENGQGSIFMAYAFAAHRAVVDVDTELGLVKVVEVATVQDVGKAMNPQALQGQLEGGIAQGLGLALMEELVVEDGHVRNGSFTDYLIPTILDMPPVRSIVLELAQPDSPYGATGAGEPPVISSPAAIAAAVRAATGRDLTRIPLRPEAVSGAG
jgi:xanthine dehydrogenase D subunit